MFEYLIFESCSKNYTVKLKQMILVTGTLFHNSTTHELLLIKGMMQCTVEFKLKKSVLKPHQDSCELERWSRTHKL